MPQNGIKYIAYLQMVLAKSDVEISKLNCDRDDRQQGDDIYSYDMGDTRLPLDEAIAAGDADYNCSMKAVNTIQRVRQCVCAVSEIVEVLSNCLFAGVPHRPTEISVSTVGLYLELTSELSRTVFIAYTQVCDRQFIAISCIRCKRAQLAHYTLTHSVQSLTQSLIQFSSLTQLTHSAD